MSIRLDFYKQPVFQRRQICLPLARFGFVHVKSYLLKLKEESK
jgi:hypothetical protein